MLVAHSSTLTEFSPNLVIAPMPSPQIWRRPDASVAEAVSYVEEALVSCLLNDLHEASSPSRKHESRLERLIRFMQSDSTEIERVPDSDLRYISDFLDAVEMGEWARAETVVLEFHEDPGQMPVLFVPEDEVQPEEERMIERLSQAIGQTLPSQSVASLEMRDYEILHVSNYLLGTAVSFH
jgi:hypothetical protein